MKQETNQQEKVVIYSALIGDIDQFREPEFDIPGCEFVLFTNNKDVKTKKYTVRHIDSNSLPTLDNRMLARLLKVKPHLFLPEYDISIWADTRVEIKVPNIVDVVRRLLKKHNMALFAHSIRSELKEEYKELVKRKKTNPYILKEQYEGYLKEGFNKTPFLAETGFIPRRHMHESIVHFGDLWWEEIQEKTPRDQMSLPYILWKVPELKFSKIPGSIWENEYTKVGDHKIGSKDYTGKWKNPNPFKELKEYIDWIRTYHRHIN